MRSARAQRFPTAVFDLRCALRWLSANAERFGIDPGRTMLAGYSAGAHLASLVGVTEDVDALEGPCPALEESQVRGVISFTGPQDLRVRDGYTREQAMLVTRFLGAFPGDVPELATRASPVAHVASDAPAFLFVHGGADHLVPMTQSREMQAELRRVGVPATVLELPDVGHRYLGLVSSGRDALRCTVLEFLERTLADGG
ncbi:MAG TPA: alpha/beta hydrolase [Gemmatimonadaceae bacterium]|nr:alpha/beta hydrolase [Gemmatimonadaceae bacterium]